MTKTELFAFISGCKLAVLGSVAPEGLPQSALVGIAVTEELEILFDTLNTTRKFRNLTANPATSFVIGWAGEKTVQFEGEAFLPEGEELERYKNIYLERGSMDRRDRAGRESLTLLFVRDGSGTATSTNGRH